MNSHKAQLIHVGGSLSLAMMAIEVVFAASSFSNSLRAFTGDSTLPLTQAAVSNAGFHFFDTTQGDIFTSNPTVALDANGATFGSYFGGDGGRNYVRTNISDYATVSFVAEITFTVGVGASPSNQELFFGMGSGNTALYGLPDWSTQFASTFVQPEIDGAGNTSFITFRTQNDANEFLNSPAPGYTNGTHRLRMAFDNSARTMTYAMDLHYSGGSFSADLTMPAVNLNHIDCPSGCGDPMMPISADFFAPDGWPAEPSRLYFGGDDFVIFEDFSVVVATLPGLAGDYNGNDVIDAADYTVWRDALTAGSTSLLNDSTPGVVNESDFTYWRAHFGESQGSAAGSASTAIPEPGSILLFCIGTLGVIALRRWPRQR